jgi:hypothetical protein
VIVPHTDETVAAGAAVQAAAVAGADGLLDIATRWGLGAGVTVAPDNDPGDVRIRYSRAHDL